MALKDQVNNAASRAYSLKALSSIFPAPIISNRAPTSSDKTNLGRIWVYRQDNSAYVLTSIINNVANWEAIGGGGAGNFDSLTVNPGPTSLTGTLTQTGASTLTGATAVVGALTQTGGNVSLSGDAVAGNVAIGTGAAAKVITLGNATGATSFNITTGTGASSWTTTNGALTINSGTGALGISTDAAITAVDIATGAAVKTVNIATGAAANVVAVGSATGAASTTLNGGTAGITLNAPFTALPGPVYLYTGAGAPGNGLALHIGDTYIRTDAGGATERMYIATAVGAWTNVTCAA